MDDIGELQKQIESYVSRIRTLKEKVRPDEEKAQLENDLGVIRYKAEENERKRKEINEIFAIHEHQRFTDNSIEELKKGRDEFLKVYSKKEADFKMIEKKLEEERLEKENKLKKLENLQNSDKELNEINIKLKDCRDKLVDYADLNISNFPVDDKYNDRIYTEAQNKLNTLVKELEAEKRKRDEEENKIETLLNEARADLSRKEGLIDLKNSEYDQTNIKITTLTKEIAELTRITKNKPRNSSNALEELNEQIDSLKETSDSFSQAYNKKTNELMELSNQITGFSKIKVFRPKIVIFRIYC